MRGYRTGLWLIGKVKGLAMFPDVAQL